MQWKCNAFNRVKLPNLRLSHQHTQVSMLAGQIGMRLAPTFTATTALAHPYSVKVAATMAIHQPTAGAATTQSGTRTATSPTAIQARAGCNMSPASAPTNCQPRKQLFLSNRNSRSHRPRSNRPLSSSNLGNCNKCSQYCLQLNQGSHRHHCLP
jgi:hypothetical protein